MRLKRKKNNPTFYDYSQVIALFKTGRVLCREEILAATQPRPPHSNVEYIVSIIDLPIWSPGTGLYKVLTDEDLRRYGCK